MRKIIDVLIIISGLLVMTWFLIQDLKYDAPFLVTFATFNLLVMAFRMAMKYI